MSIVKVAPEAVRDLKDIGGYIARDNPERAVSYVRELRAKMEKIGENPKGYPKRIDLDLNIRSAPYQSYLIFFHILENGTVEIVRVIHGARDIEDLLG
jgi:toxin ParE1/3/4